MGDDECKIHLDAMREVYMLVVLNLKMSHDRYPPSTGNPYNTELKNRSSGPELIGRTLDIHMTKSVIDGFYTCELSSA